MGPKLGRVSGVSGAEHSAGAKPESGAGKQPTSRSGTTKTVRDHSGSALTGPPNRSMQLHVEAPYVTTPAISERKSALGPLATVDGLDEPG